MADVQVSWSQLWVAPTTVISSAQASQTVGNFTQTATATLTDSDAIDVSYASLWLPEGANATRNLSAAQTVGDFTQSATMYDPIASIDGGGTITEGYPHRSAGATQTVGAFLQSAAMGAEGTPGPALVDVAQTVGDYTQTATVDVSRNIIVAQTVGDYTQEIRVIDPDRRPEAPPAPAPGSGRKWFRTRWRGRLLRADSFDDLRRLVQRLEAENPEPQEVPPAEPPGPIKATIVEPTVEDMVRKQLAAQTAAMQAQMQQWASEHEARVQAYAQQFQQRADLAEQQARAAMAFAQRAQNDAKALAALLTE